MPNQSSQSEIAYQYIRTQVFTGELPPGHRLVNRSLAKELGSSFIPVREAISRLVAEGIVKKVPNAGAFVRKFGRRDMAEIYDVRELFEPAAAALAARFITDLEMRDLEVILNDWEALRDTVSRRERGATAADMERWVAINQKFREGVIAAARNQLLLKIVRDLQILTHCFSAQQHKPGILSEPLMQFTVSSYRELLDALGEQDSEAAEEIVRKQLRHGKENILPHFE